jgi:hypothetical protein
VAVGAGLTSEPESTTPLSLLEEDEAEPKTSDWTLLYAGLIRLDGGGVIGVGGDELL